jgi:mono/diheme cytochrome c family protein
MTLNRLGIAAITAVTFGVAVAQSTRSVWTGVYTSEQAATGADLYEGRCAECHGDDLEGRERAPALAGGTFAQRWDRATLKTLFERVEAMPPDRPGARLTAKQNADVLAFLLNANNVPAGATPLSDDKGVLSGITYTSQRPKF